MVVFAFPYLDKRWGVYTPSTDREPLRLKLIASIGAMTSKAEAPKASSLLPTAWGEDALVSASSKRETIPRDTAEGLSHQGLGEDASTMIHKAGYRKQVPPVYPRRAIELSQEGTVLLHAKVALDGVPMLLKVAESSGYRLLDVAALSAVKKWEFEPIRHEGRPLVGWVRVPVHFVLDS